MYQYIQTLDFYSKPDYELIQSHFMEILMEIGEDFDFQYEWLSDNSQNYLKCGITCSTERLSASLMTQNKERMTLRKKVMMMKCC